MQISIIGLGRLGSCFAASVANAGITVHGVDIDPAIRAAIRENRAPFPEPQLSNYIQSGAQHMTVSSDIADSIDDSQVVFVFVNTYEDDERGYALSQLNEVIADITHALQSVKSPPLIVIRSTTMPGDIDGEISAKLTNISEHSNLDICYWPELTALGQVIQTMEDPDFRLIGQNSVRAGDELEAFIQRWRDDDVPLIRTDVTSAELSKMAINTYVAMKMSFANGLAQISHSVGADVDDVTNAMSQDGRINGNYFTGGVRYGGPCFPHDTVAFDELAQNAETAFPLARAASIINENHTTWISDSIRSHSSDSDTIGILGLTYKPGVPVVTESQGMELISELKQDYEIVAYDQIGATKAKELVNDENIIFTDDISKTTELSDTAVVALRDSESICQYSKYANLTLIDPWRMFDYTELGESVSYLPLPGTTMF